MQDWVAIAIAVAAGSWLAWSLTRRCLAPPCRPADAPGGCDGFVALDAVARSGHQKSRGGPKAAPNDC